MEGWLQPRARLRAGLLRSNPLFARLGLSVEPLRPHWERFPTVDFPASWQNVVERVAPYTLTPPTRVGALLQSVEHVVRNDVHGAFVECGVWRGGSAMAVALALLQLGEQRDLYLFDTFEGMSAPTEADVSYLGKREIEGWSPEARGAEVSLEDVRHAMRSTGYPEDRVRYVKGTVEDTVPATAPDEIAILRLDTDWYESTKHELEHLWPRVGRGGILIVDDYGHYAGARKAVDEYFGPNVFLHRLDYTGRLLIKP